MGFEYYAYICRYIILRNIYFILGWNFSLIWLVWKVDFIRVHFPHSFINEYIIYLLYNKMNNIVVKIESVKVSLFNNVLERYIIYENSIFIIRLQR